MSTMLKPHFLGYHLNGRQLSQTFVDAGGDLRDLHPDGVPAMRLTRTVLFHYLMPGKVQIWLNTAADDTDTLDIGVTFVIGQYNDELDDIDKHLRTRCQRMFRREPDHFVEVGATEHDPHGEIFEWWRGDKLLGKLSMDDFLGSEEEPEHVNIERLIG